MVSVMAYGGDMQLRITRTLPPRFNGFDTHTLQLNRTYDVGRALAEMLIRHGFAVATEQTLPKADGRAASHLVNTPSEGPQ
jgi:hypothetical protein